MDIVDRIFELLDESGMEQQAFAVKIGADKYAVSKWRNRKLTSYRKYLPRIAEVLNTTVQWLLTGEGDKVRKTAPREPSSPNGVMVPVLGDVAGGLPLLAVENILDYEEVSKDVTDAGEVIGLRVKGQSMEPRICDGDVVIVRRQNDVDTGDVAVVLVNGDESTVKRIKKEPDGSLWLIPNNPAFEAKHFSPQEQETLPVTIYGKVIELRGKF